MNTLTKAMTERISCELQSIIKIEPEVIQNSVENETSSKCFEVALRKKYGM